MSERDDECQARLARVHALARAVLAAEARVNHARGEQVDPAIEDHSRACSALWTELARQVSAAPQEGT